MFSLGPGRWYVVPADRWNVVSAESDGAVPLDLGIRIAPITQASAPKDRMTL